MNAQVQDPRLQTVLEWMTELWFSYGERSQREVLRCIERDRALDGWEVRVVRPPGRNARPDVIASGMPPVTLAPVVTTQREGRTSGRGK